jgi:guanyl-specific ribonuclease Sa
MRIWVSVFIAVMFLSFLSAAQSVQSQQYTTATMTTLTTSTQPSTIVVDTETMTTNQTQSRSIFSAPVTIPGTHGVCGIYFQQPFNATAGSTLSGTFTSNSKVDFYVMTQGVFHSWSHQVVAGGNCTPSSLILSQHDTTSYNFTTTIPSTGLYQIIVNNLSESTVTAQLTASLSTTTPSMATVTVYSTTMQEYVQTIMQNSTGTLQASSGSMNTTLPIAIGVIIIILAVVAYTIRTKRNSSKK